MKQADWVEEQEEKREILYNAIQCRHCGLVLQSLHRHDVRSHTCTTAPMSEWNPESEWVEGKYTKTGRAHPPWIMVDGGKDYLRCGGEPKDYRFVVAEDGKVLSTEESFYESP